MTMTTREAVNLAVAALVHQAKEQHGNNRHLLAAIERLLAVNAQRGCEVYERTTSTLPEFIDVMIDG